MSFRGLDFSPGINQYAELLRSAYQDRQKQDQMEIQSNIAQQQANSLYGYEGPGVNQVPNLFFNPQAMGQMTPMPNSLNQNQIPQTGQPEQSLPSGMQDYQQDPNAMLMQDADREPAQSQSEIDAYNRSVMAQKQEAARLAQEEANRAKKGQSGTKVSAVDQLIKQYASQETVSPFVLRHLLDLKEKEMQYGNRGDDHMTTALKLLGGRGDFMPDKKVQAKGKPVDPKAGIRSDIKAIKDIMKEIEIPAMIKALPGSFERWKSTTSDGQQYRQYEQQLADLTKQLGGGEPQKTMQVKINGKWYTKEQAIQTFPKNKAQIELQFKSLEKK